MSVVERVCVFWDWLGATQSCCCVPLLVYVGEVRAVVLHICLCTLVVYNVCSRKGPHILLGATQDTSCCSVSLLAYVGEVQAVVPHICLCKLVVYNVCSRKGLRIWDLLGATQAVAVYLCWRTLV